MKAFRGTILFTFIVAAVVSFAIFEFKQSDKEQENKSTEGRIFGALRDQDIQVLNFIAEGRNYKLTHDQQIWRIDATFQDQADDDAVGDFLRNLLAQKVESVDPEGQAISWAKYGLDAPMATITVTTTSGQNLSVDVGSVRTFDQGFYLKNKNEEQLLVGAKSWETILAQDADRFRNRKINLDSADFNKITITQSNNGNKITTELHKNEGQWVSVKHAELLLDPAAVQDYIISIRNLRAEGIAANDQESPSLAKYKLTNPNVSIELTSVEGKLFKILATQSTNSEWVLTSSSNKPIYKISQPAFITLQKVEDDFRDKNFIFKYEDQKVSSLSIHKKDITLEMIKNEQGWRFKEEQEKKPNDVAIAKLLTELKELKALSFALPERSKLKFEYKISLKDKDDKLLFVLDYGGATKTPQGQEVYLAKTNLSLEPFTILKSAIDSLTDLEFTQVEKKP